MSSMVRTIKNQGAIWYDQLAYTPVVNQIYIATSQIGLISISFNAGKASFLSKMGCLTSGDVINGPDVVKSSTLQLLEYLHGERKTFTIPLDLSWATKFQVSVLLEVIKVPYGEIKSYADIAAQIGRPNAARAVGQSNARNLLPIVIPCHRIIGSDGSLCGYSAHGGLKIKQELLELETETQNNRGSNVS